MVYNLVQILAGWRPKKSQCFSSSPKVGKDPCPSSAVRQEFLFPPLLFQPVLQMIGWSSSQVKEGICLLSPLIQVLISPRNIWQMDASGITFGQMSVPNPVTESHWHAEWTITGTYRGSYLNCLHIWRQHRAVTAPRSNFTLWPHVPPPVTLPSIIHTRKSELNSVPTKISSTLALPAAGCRVCLKSEQTALTRHIACDFIE